MVHAGFHFDIFHAACNIGFDSPVSSHFPSTSKFQAAADLFLERFSPHGCCSSRNCPLFEHVNGIGHVWKRFEAGLDPRSRDITCMGCLRLSTENLI